MHLAPMLRSFAVTIVVAGLHAGCGDDGTAASPDAGGQDATSAAGGDASPPQGNDGGGSTAPDAAAPDATADAGADAGADADTGAPQVTTAPTGLYITTGGGVGRSDDVELRLRVGAPLPHASGRSENLKLRLGIAPPASR